MRYDKDTNEYLLASGRRFYANGGILGLGCFDDTLTQGYDGLVWLEDDMPLTPAERAEIAAAMIARWQAWKICWIKP